MNVERITIDTSNFAIDPKSKTYDKKLDNIPGYPEFKHKNKKKLLTYLIIHYDKNSPIRRDMSLSFAQKKRKCLEICALTVADKIPGEVVNMLAGESIEFCKFMSYYISLQHSPELFMLAAYEVAISSSLLKISTEYDSASLKVMESIVEKHISLEKKMFGGEEMIGFKIALTEKAAEYINDFRVEAMVDKLESGELPKSWGKYGDYKPDDIEFVGDELPEKRKSAKG